MNIFKRLFGGGKTTENAGDQLPIEPRTPVTIPDAWKVNNRFTQDYIDAHTYAVQECAGWDYYVPYMRMVPCSTDELKPAMFLKVGDDYRLWSRTTELRSLEWQWYAKEDYVALRLSSHFEDSERGLIGCGEQGVKYVATQQMLEDSGHKLVCSNFFDPADDESGTMIECWAKMSGVIVIFFVQNNCENMNFVYYDLPPQSKEVAINQFEEARVELSKIGPSTGSFEQTCKALSELMPYQSRWK
ncbi:MAG: hypothetical protein ACYC1M_01685 [Armatimonadota bacterium]